MKVKKVVFVILSALVLALMLAVLELNKNTLLGFAILLIVTAGFYVLHRVIVKRKDKWFLKTFRMGRQDRRLAQRRRGILLR